MDYELIATTYIFLLVQQWYGMMKNLIYDERSCQLLLSYARFDKLTILLILIKIINIVTPNNA